MAVVRTNLIKNPSLESNLPSLGAATQTASTTIGVVAGTQSIALSASSASNDSFGELNAAGTIYAGLIPGKTYTISGYITLTAPLTGALHDRSRRIVLFVNSAGYTEYKSTQAPNTAGTHRVSLTFTLPSSFTEAFFRLYHGGISGSGSVYWDGILLEEGAALGNYFDGNTVTPGFGYVWTGAANNSTSTEDDLVRTNYFKTPSLESALPGGGAVNQGSSTTIGVIAGTKSLALTPTGASNDSYAESNALGTLYAGLTPGKTYTISGYITLTAPVGGTLNSRALRIVVFTRVGIAGYVEAMTSQAANVAGTTRVSGSFTVPSGVTELFIRFYHGGTSGDVYWDAILLEEVATLGTYFDGDKTQTGYAYAWSGTAHNSISTARPSVTNISSGLSGTGTLTSKLTNYLRIASGFNGSGVLTTALHRNINSQLSGSGALVSQLSNYQRISSSLSGSGVLTSVLGRILYSGFNGSGALTSVLQRHIATDLSGTGALASTLTGYRKISSHFSSEGSLSSVLSGPALGKQISSALSGFGSLSSRLSGVRPQIISVLGGEGVLYSELTYTRRPATLTTGLLGRLASFSVSTSAVPINPAEGSGSTPSVNAGYIKTPESEFALGETNLLSHGAVGSYEGEIVRLSLPEGSDVAAISQDTALTLLNNELTIFPFIDAAPSVWTAARAVDYWTQQCGLFYDKVPGDCIAYASGFGHTDCYGSDSTARFYEKRTGGTAATTVLNGRSVRTLGSAVTGTTAFHEKPKAKVAVSVPVNRKLVASIGLGLRGTGRTTTVTWSLLDSREARHTITLMATSAGDITASLGGVPVSTATVAPNADYRLAFSLERVSDTAVVGKLTVHTDDLAGTGELVHESPATGASYALPAVAYLTSITHASTGGSGSQMLRWGTYLTVARNHPLELSAVQKALSATGKEFGFVSGFEGNVWALLNEYCAITRLDVAFLDAKLTLTPRIAGLAAPRGNFSRFSRDSERREKYKQVAVVNKQSKAVSTDDAVFWRADSVFQVAAREVFETTVQTGHSILNLVQPVAVSGILPFPYKKGGGQYVVTGADGYIIAPAWWNDNGGKVEVSLTGKEGEIAIKITAPIIDTVRAPYRISEGEADRPALYVCGSGILNDPKEVHVGTGASNAKEGFDSVFESPFIAGVLETYDTAAAMAAEYSASNADVSFELPNDFYTPSRFGQYPAGTRFTDGKRNYRITGASQTHSKVSGNAVPHTTIGDYVASYPAGATLADEKARHRGRSIKQFNISPLKGS